MTNVITVGYGDKGVLKIPSNEYVVKAVQILAKKRSGKSYTAGLIAEQLLKDNYPIVVIDPIGAHSGLKEKFDLIAIGDSEKPYTDIPISDNKKQLPELAIKIAEFVSTSTRSFLIDLSDLQETHQQIFAAPFFKTLYKLNKQRRHLFVEEADIFAPQICQWDEVLHSRHQLDNLVRRGGQKGIGTTVITQRPALVSKNILTQSDLTIIMNMQSPQDLDPVTKILRSRKMNKDGIEALKDKITELQVGYALFFSPAWLHINEFVKIAKRVTYHAGATLGDPEWRDTFPSLVEPKGGVEALKKAIESLYSNDKEKKENVTGNQTVGNREIENLQRDLKFLKEHNENLIEENNDLKKDLEERRKEIEHLGKRCVKAEFEIENFRTFKSLLRQMFPESQNTTGQTNTMEVDINSPLKAVVKVKPQPTLSYNEDTMEGKIAYLLSNKFFESVKSKEEIYYHICNNWEIARSEKPGGTNANRFKKKLKETLDMMTKRPYEFLIVDDEGRYTISSTASDRISLEEEK